MPQSRLQTICLLLTLGLIPTSLVAAQDASDAYDSGALEAVASPDYGFEVSEIPDGVFDGSYEGADSVAITFGDLSAAENGSTGGFIRSIDVIRGFSRVHAPPGIVGSTELIHGINRLEEALLANDDRIANLDQAGREALDRTLMDAYAHNGQLALNALQEYQDTIRQVVDGNLFDRFRQEVVPNRVFVEYRGELYDIGFTNGEPTNDFLVGGHNDDSGTPSPLGQYLITDDSRFEALMRGSLLLQEITLNTYSNSLVFNAAVYKALYPDLVHLNRDELLYHWLSVGIQEGRQASIGFKASDYLELSPDLKQQFGTDYAAALQHYVTFGHAEGRKGVIYTNSLVFVPAYYRALNPGLAHLNNVELTAHWVHHGIAEGRQGAMKFKAEDYVWLNQDASHGFLNNHHHAIFHYVAWGHDQQREGSILFHPLVFNTTYYRTLNPGLAHLDTPTLLQHWVFNGIAEGRQACLRFQAAEFRILNGDIDFPEGNASAIWHYAVWAHEAGRQGSIFTNPLVFNPGAYKELNPEFGQWTNANLTAHWLSSGIHEGRQGTRTFNSFEYLEQYSDLQTYIGRDHYSLTHHYVTSGHGEGRRGRF